MADRGEVVEHDLGGVPLLHLPTDEPWRAGIVFGVGVVDEQLSTRGINHLAGHLLVHGLGSSDRHRHLDDGVLTTELTTSGDDTDVKRLFTDVSVAVADLPTALMPMEKSVVRGERRRQPIDVERPLVARRYGPTGPGLAGYGELGLFRLGPDDLDAWVGRHFTAANAVAWVAGPDVPMGLALELPTGSRRSTPRFDERLAGPARVLSADHRVRFDLELAHTAEAHDVARQMTRELDRSVADLPGASVVARTDLRSPGRLGVSLRLDPAGRLDDLVERLADMVEDWSDGLLQEAEESLRPVDADRETVRRAATTRLLGSAPAEVTTEALLADAVETMVVELPAAATWPFEGFARVDDPQPPAVDGVEKTSREEPDTTIVLGADAVARRRGDSRHVVRLADATVIAWPDGTRRLIAPDATDVTVDPDDLGLRSSAIARLDRAVSADRVVRQSDRPTAASETPEVERPSWRTRERRPLDIVQVVGWLLLLAAGVSGVYLAYVTVTTPFDDEPDGLEFYVAEAIVWVAWLAFAWLGWTLARDDDDLEEPDE